MRLALLILVVALPALVACGGDDPQRSPEPTVAAAPPPPAPTATPSATREPAEPRRREPRPRSRAAGAPWSGRLVHGRPLPASGAGYVTWDPIRKEIGNRGWRRWGSGRLLRTVQGVLAAYQRRHPNATPVLVGDLSRPRGGDFGPRYGGLGHVSHQNGLDADVYYPRRDGRRLAPRNPGQVDRRAAQELVDAFVRAGAERVFVGPSLGLRGPRRVVSPLIHHDDHLHLRLPGAHERR